MNSKAKMRHCFNCGAELGVYADHDPLDHCGELGWRDRHNQDRARPSAGLDREAVAWTSIAPGKRFGVRLTEDAVPHIAPGSLLMMHSDDPWLEMPEGIAWGEVLRFTGSVRNDFPLVGPHLEVAHLDGRVIAGGGYVYRIFKFVSDPVALAPTDRVAELEKALRRIADINMGGTRAVLFAREIAKAALLPSEERGSGQ